MAFLPDPRRLLTLDALFARRRPLRAEREEPQLARMPDDADELTRQEMASSQLGRIAAEVALQEGARRQYAPREESRVLESRRGEAGSFRSASAAAHRAARPGHWR